MNLLLAAALLLQDPSAEDLLKGLVETVEKAKTLSVRFSTRMVKVTGEEGTLQGKILMKEGNRLRWDLSMLRGSASRELTVVSDGVKVASLTESRLTQEKATPDDFNVSLSGPLVRGGALSLVAGFLTFFSTDEKGLSEVAKLASVTDLKRGEDDGGKKTLRYRVLITPQSSKPLNADVRLWYAPDSHQLSKRTMTYSSETESGTITETYEEFTLNAEIPDETFKLPEGKAPGRNVIVAPLPPPGPPRAEVIIPQEPPAPKEEAIPGDAPTPNHIWIGGFWAWNGRGFTWVKGAWRPRPRPEAVWVEGHWDRRENGWVRVNGYWK